MINTPLPQYLPSWFNTGISDEDLTDDEEENPKDNSRMEINEKGNEQKQISANIDGEMDVRDTKQVEDGVG